MKRSLSLLDILIALFVLLFVYTASAKLLLFADNVKSMHNQPLAGWLADFLVYAIPICELIIVALLIIERAKLVGLYLFTAMMMAFTGYVALVLSNHYGRIPCSCGGVMKELNWKAHLYLNILFVGMAMIAIYLAKRNGHNDMAQYTSAIG